MVFLSADWLEQFANTKVLGNFYPSHSRENSKAQGQRAAMPLKVFTEEEQKVLAKKVESQLQYLLDQNQIDSDLQWALFDGGCVTMRRLVNMEEDKAGVRKVLKTQYGLDAETSFKERNLVADILEVWEDAKDVAAREREIKAEKKVGRSSGSLPVPTRVMEHKSMRKAFAAQHGRLQDRFDPGRYFLGTKLE